MGRSLIHTLPLISGPVIVFYMVALALIGFVVSRTHRVRNTGDYFLAGSRLGWLPVGGSLFVTTIGSGWLLGVAGIPLWNDGPMVFSAFLGVVFILILGWWFAPRYLDACVFTVPQFVEKRFGQPAALTLSSVTIIFNLAVRIPLVLVGGSWILEEMFGWDLMSSAMLILMVTGLYTIVGGFASVIYTQVFQGMLVLGGTAFLAFAGPLKHGDDVGLTSRLVTSLQTMLVPGNTPGMSWPIPMLGVIVIGIWYWFSDQYVVQRILSARRIQDARRGTWFGATLIVIELALLAIFLTRNGSLSSLSTINGGISDIAIETILIGMLALLMAALAGYFQSTAALFTMDFFYRTQSHPTDAQMVLVGRLATTVVVILGILIISGAGLVGLRTFGFMQEIQAAVAPPVAAVILFGVFRNPARGKAALYTLIIGEGLGLGYLLVRAAASDAGEVLFGTGGLDGLSFAGLSFLISVLLLVGIGRIVDAPEPVSPIEQQWRVREG